ncbi:related to protein BRO1, required for normal response to nutrient limitation [Cephalotrichum gorgonifer]|uniref:BRO domain-containing protein 1 n=1 Tax=Cephalotrichum gorgonifer TaxID=2041049 RepID=A0AAE8SZE8_9PEZI|nr:related to protein BRO1, required for normal response to nutrient limitation [Cephalotrichum gorgonifer]
MPQAPMISVPLKATNEIDWVGPLKNYIQNTYGDDPERYAEECATLNRLRQDMRGAGKDSTSGRDMLYRYYGQLELLDLRFPIDEKHIKISFTWFDAFTHKSTSQYSLAFEKASIIFNISAVLSCHAAIQNRSEESGLKMAYHSFQASAGMFTYINENFLHAPSSDLSRETVKTLIQIALAQATEVFLEKQIMDKKKVGLLAKLSSQAAYLYDQALEGTQDNVNRVIFEKVWLLLVQTKASYLGSLAQHYQAQADDDANNHGVAVGRLQVAERLGKEANRLANSFPNSIPPSSNLTSDSSAILADITKRHLTSVQEKLAELAKDNDYIYHQPVPSEAGLSPVPKLPAAKPIPVTELYAGQDIQRITGPDLFSKIVPMNVTESASLYDEEKAKLVRAETERVDVANGEMAASLDYLRLPGALQVLKGGLDQEEVLPDDDFKTWCEDVAAQENPVTLLESLNGRKASLVVGLDSCKKELDMEESVCEKMRSKYGAEWTQQPSAGLTTTLRGDVRSYREALDEASRTDAQLAAKLRQNELEFDEMRAASERGEVDNLFQRSVSKLRGRSSNSGSPMDEPNLLDADFDDGQLSVAEQIARVEDLLKKLSLLKRERNQILKDLKEKIHNDDISQILILNKKSIQNYENQLFQAELEKFAPHQNRLLQANHKQSALLKELSATFNTLLQDKRVRSEQSKYENAQRQRVAVTNRYKRAYQEFLDLVAGLHSAKNWYAEMKDSVESLEKNVQSFVHNRRTEGAQLLNQIEKEKSANQSSQAEMERDRLRELMDRMTVGPQQQQQQSGSPKPQNQSRRPPPAPLFSPGGAARYADVNYASQYPLPNSPPAHQTTYGNFSGQAGYQPQGGPSYGQPAAYNPSQYGMNPGPASPPPTQTSFGTSTYRGPASPPPTQTSFGQSLHGYGGYQAQQQQQQQQGPQAKGRPTSQVPPGFVPPPPPPGPPPLGPQQTIHFGSQDYPVEGQQGRGQHQQQADDPWAGLSAWK